MGCGQSKIHLYPRKSKSKANGKKSGHGEYLLNSIIEVKWSEDEDDEWVKSPWTITYNILIQKYPETSLITFWKVRTTDKLPTDITQNISETQYRYYCESKTFLNKQ